jgi:Rrf2 family transcriptional regulator, cysteine metabolism repressor
MQVPMRVEYGLRAVMELAGRRDQGLLRTAEIAQARAIPEAFLDQILIDLRKAGIVRSVRGPSGGHELIPAPASLSLGQVARALGDDVLTVACMREGRCVVFDTCVLEDIWRDLASQYADQLNAISIDELIGREAERRARDLYHI